MRVVETVSGTQAGSTTTTTTTTTALAAGTPNPNPPAPAVSTPVRPPAATTPHRQSTPQSKQMTAIHHFSSDLNIRLVLLLFSQQLIMTEVCLGCVFFLPLILLDTEHFLCLRRQFCKLSSSVYGHLQALWDV
jgi:hypothetical protein